VTLEGGEQIAADVVIAAVSPRLALNTLLPPLSMSTQEIGAARTVRSRGTLAKVHLGLSEPAAWKGRPGKSFERVRVGGAHLDDLERAFDAVKYRELAAKPVLDVAVSSSGRPSLSILASAFPIDLKGGWTAEAKAKVLASVLEVLETAAPGVKGLVKSSEVLSPADLESEFGAIGGSIHHAERALDQMVFMRPARPFARFATPVEGLFLGSSGCHPGPGVTLAPGVLAARAATA
jgi:phytoene dehydrogenase-like protein